MDRAKATKATKGKPTRRSNGNRGAPKARITTRTRREYYMPRAGERCPPGWTEEKQHGTRSAGAKPRRCFRDVKVETMGSKVAGLASAMGAAGVSNRSASRSSSRSRSRSSRSVSSHEGPAIKPPTFIYPPNAPAPPPSSSSNANMNAMLKGMRDLGVHPGDGRQYY